LSKETFYVPYLNIDNNKSQDNDETLREDDEKIIDENDAESSDPDEETISQTKR